MTPCLEEIEKKIKYHLYLYQNKDRVKANKNVTDFHNESYKIILEEFKGIHKKINSHRSWVISPSIVPHII